MSACSLHKQLLREYSNLFIILTKKHGFRHDTGNSRLSGGWIEWAGRNGILRLNIYGTVTKELELSYSVYLYLETKKSGIDEHYSVHNKLSQFDLDRFLNDLQRLRQTPKKQSK